MEQIILEARKISKYFHDPNTIQVLKEISFEMRKSEFVSVIGKSGCGKSTLLYILSTMDTDYEGELLINGEAMRGKKEAAVEWCERATIYNATCKTKPWKYLLIPHDVITDNMELASLARDHSVSGYA